RGGFVGGGAGRRGLASFGRGEQPGRVYRIGYLTAGAASSPLFAAFPNAFPELGWIEGKNYTLERRYADNRIDRLQELARELVDLNVDVIVTGGTPAPLALKQATTTIPAVIISAADPVA